VLKKLIRRVRQNKPPRDWEQEYKEGKWRMMSGLDELTRYWVAVGYCSQIARPSILDVGCGPGFLEEKLRLLPYGSYVGMDISPTALREAHQKMPATGQVICADFNQPPVAGPFDRIIFMESLDSDMPAAQIFEKYLPLLSPNGRIVFSLFDGASGSASDAVWEDVRTRFVIEDASRLHNVPTGKRWTVALLGPK
jgi:SAM-dependent methyltransferase